MGLTGGAGGISGGQTTMANAAPVVISSDQTSIPVASTLSAETTKVIGTVNAVPLDGTRVSYSAADSKARGTTTTDFINITGSNSKTIRITEIRFSATQTTAGVVAVCLQKRSTLNTGGTPSTLFAVPNDSASAPATAVVTYYASTPVAGVSIGLVRNSKVLVPVPAGTSAQEIVWTFGDRPSQALVLRGAAENVSISLVFAGTLTGATVAASIEWTEES